MVRARVMLACNDENGNWSGHVDAINVELGDDEWQFEVYDSDLWSLERFDGELRINGQFSLPYTVYGTWVGNWCWDQVTVAAEDARRLRDWLGDVWTCSGESGPHLEAV